MRLLPVLLADDVLQHLVVEAGDHVAAERDDLAAALALAQAGRELLLPALARLYHLRVYHFLAHAALAANIF